MQQKEFTTHVLPNGLRLIHAWMPRTVSHCALVIQAGTRDEGEGESGLAHFIEHVLFKGTHARKAFHILNRMESVGGEVNAYTTKEETWITSSQRTEHTERALELIADIAFNSVFPEGELEKERDVILDEIASVEDQPGDVIFEDFESRVFAGHPLSRRILGEADVVKTLTRSQVLSFIDRHYRPSNMVLGVVGSMTWKQVKAWAEKHFGDCPSREALPRTSQALPVHVPFLVKEPKGIHQMHHVGGCVAPGGNHEQRLPMTIMANLLGGPAMNCRLNLNIRERYGMAYHIEANHMIYQDAGLFNIYFGTDTRFHDKVERLVRKEIEQLRNRALGTRQLHETKQQLLGQMALGQDHGASLLASLVKSYLTYDRVESTEAVLKAIDGVEAMDLMEVAQTWLSEDQWSSLVYATQA
jgi:predicted Zn-dependent peptidase